MSHFIEARYVMREYLLLGLTDVSGERTTSQLLPGYQGRWRDGEGRPWLGHRRHL